MCMHKTDACDDDTHVDLWSGHVDVINTAEICIIPYQVDIYFHYWYNFASNNIISRNSFLKELQWLCTS